MVVAAAAEFQPVCPASVDRLPVSPPSRAQTVTNNLALVSGASPAAAAGGAVKDTNIRGAGSMEGVETVRVTDMTSGSAFTKSIGSLFSSINRSVSSAFNSLMAAPPAATDSTQTAAAATTAPATVAGQLGHGNVDSVAFQQQQQQFGRHRPYQHYDVPDWHRAQPQFYNEPPSYRGKLTKGVDLTGLLGDIKDWGSGAQSTPEAEAFL